MASPRALLLIAALVLACLSAPCGAHQPRVLVLRGSDDLTETHTEFLADLTSLASNVDVKDISDGSLQLQDWGTWLYDALVIVGSKQGETCSAFVSDRLGDRGIRW